MLSCSNSLQKGNPLQNDCNDTIPFNKEYKDFLLANSPTRQFEVCRNENECFFGNSPTLAELCKNYGAGLPKAWLIPQLDNLSEYCNLKEKASTEQLRDLAIIIYNDYHWLKIDELMLFFYRFKSYHYKCFYSYFDPMVVLGSLKLFLVERNASYERAAQTRREKQAEIDRRNAITYEEYQRRKVCRAISNKEVPNSDKG